MLAKVVKPTARVIKPTSGEIKAMYEEAKAVAQKPVKKLDGHDIDDLGSSFANWVKQKVEDIDYDYGKDMVHGSSRSGLTELSPSVSAAAQQGSFGLTADGSNGAAVFGYDIDQYGKGFRNYLASSLQEHAGESMKSSLSDNEPTAYLARVPFSGLHDHKDLIGKGWIVSRKPAIVKDSFPMRDHAKLTEWLESLGTKTVDQFVEETRSFVDEEYDSVV